MAFAGVQHGFDGKDHAGLERHPLAGIAIVKNLRLIVINLADSVTTVFTHDAETVFLRNRLNRVTNVTQRSAGANRANAGPHRLISGVDQP